MEYIGALAFDVCESLTSVTLPASLGYIGAYGFSSCRGLRLLICQALTPPICERDDVFDQVPVSGDPSETCKLFVPKESLELYATTAPWNEFQQILPIQDAGVSFTLQEKTETFKVFDLQGKHVIETSNPSDIENLPRDIYIINGKKSLVGK